MWERRWRALPGAGLCSPASPRSPVLPPLPTAPERGDSLPVLPPPPRSVTPSRPPPPVGTGIAYSGKPEPRRAARRAEPCGYRCGPQPCREPPCPGLDGPRGDRHRGRLRTMESGRRYRAPVLRAGVAPSRQLAPGVAPTGRPTGHRAPGTWGRGPCPCRAADKDAGGRPRPIRRSPWSPCADALPLPGEDKRFTRRLACVSAPLAQHNLTAAAPSAARLEPGPVRCHQRGAAGEEVGTHRVGQRPSGNGTRETGVPTAGAAAGAEPQAVLGNHWLPPGPEHIHVSLLGWRSPSLPSSSTTGSPAFPHHGEPKNSRLQCSTALCRPFPTAAAARLAKISQHQLLPATTALHRAGRGAEKQKGSVGPTTQGLLQASAWAVDGGPNPPRGPPHLQTPGFPVGVNAGWGAQGVGTPPPQHSHHQ